MAEHEKPYTRLTGKDGEEIGKLGPQCGHHCGVIQVGGTDTHMGHCGCKECHNLPKAEIDSTLMPGMKAEGVDFRGIS